MSVHIQTLSGRNLNLSLRIYSGVPDEAPAYHHRLDFDAVCLATIKPESQHVAWISAYKGDLESKTYYDIGEALYDYSGVKEVMYERAEGYIIHLVRKGKRRWKRIPVKRENVHVLAINFSGMED